MNKLILWFVKVTGAILTPFYYNKKLLKESLKTKRYVKGGALIISNHTSVWDYPLIMYTFFLKDIYFLCAEVIFNKSKLMAWFIKKLGAIRVNRDTYDFSFASKMIQRLKKGKTGLVFPEAKVNETNELLEFKSSYILIALEANVPIIPMYTNGMYGKKKRINKKKLRVCVGDPIYPSKMYNPDFTEKENINLINDFVKAKINELKGIVERR